MVGHYPKPVEEMVKLLSYLPGVGRKTAERYVFDIICNWSNKQKEQLVQACSELPRLRQCIACGVVTDGEKCLFCNDPNRDSTALCVVANSKEVFAIESTQRFRGHYHVLDSLISPLDRRGVEKLALQRVEERLKMGKIVHVLLALDSSVEGEASAHYLKNFFQKYSVAVHRLAFGIPMNASLEYIDANTLAKAIERGVPF